MAEITLPCTLFETQRWMDDYGAADMRCGDLSEAQLKNQFNLQDVSTRVDPYTLTRITPFTQPQSMFYGMHGAGEKVSREECIKLLFDEMRHLSTPFAAYGPYRHLISKMISHMQYGNGKPFQDSQLDAALKEQIINDNSPEKSSRFLIGAAIANTINWSTGSLESKKLSAIQAAIQKSVLPKFMSINDSFNGLGISVHDIYAFRIVLQSLEITGNSYRAVLHYHAQDHFGLDNSDINQSRFNHLRFFRIWFVLQRYEKLAIRPFMTNMAAEVEVLGGRP